MNVLLVTNSILPEIAQDINVQSSVREGWIDGMLSALYDESLNLNITVCFPQRKQKELLTGKTPNYRYIGFYKSINDEFKFTEELVAEFNQVLGLVPDVDIVHIMGTEYGHTLAMVKECQKEGKLNCVVISIQGLISFCAQHYYAGIPLVERYRQTIRDLIRGENVAINKKSFVNRGKYEIQALQIVNHVIGRTDLDRAATKLNNPDIQYHFCNETLRSCFYSGSWTWQDCKRHTIFCSQAYYPIKGFHYVLEAVHLLKKRYPNICVKVTGKDLIHCGLKDRLRLNNYSSYIRRLIFKYNLQDNVVFLGELSAEQMKEQYLKANVFISASSIENSPNSVGEAMILGTPVVSSDVGGVKNILTHGTDGYLYQHDAPYMLWYYIMSIFENRELAERFSVTAKEHIRVIHDRKRNRDRLIDIYDEIVKVK